MISLRRSIERGLKHPLLGPICLILLALLLAMVFLHATHDGPGAATDVEAFCLAIVTLLAVLVLERVRRSAPAPTISLHSSRAPPAIVTPPLLLLARSQSPFTYPLRP